MTDEQFLTTGEAAALLGVHIDTIRRWERDGYLSCVRTPGNHRKFRRSDVEKLMAEPEPAA